MQAKTFLWAGFCALLQVSNQVAAFPVNTAGIPQRCNPTLDLSWRPTRACYSANRPSVVGMFTRPPFALFALEDFPVKVILTGFSFCQNR